MDLNLRDQVALVAGSSRGIGAAIAVSLLGEGMRVAVTGRDAAVLDRACEEWRARFGRDRVLPIAGSLGDEHHIDRTIAAITQEWTAPDCVVANVGTGRVHGGWDVDDADWQASFEANFAASRRLARRALPAMIERGRGSVVFIASIAGIESLNAPISYIAAKSALIAFAKSLAREVAATGVRVNTVAPGNVLFAGGSWDARLAADHDGVMRYIRAEVPMQRFGTAQEIADVVTFLCSPRASFVTGSCVLADGGQTRTFA